ncbi:MAG: YdeI/OmpD-associated family protein [Candidatus Tenebribacter burtonii]|jgi:uncharacterized protein YdeI (YjbR/CyaY-like superfamily)|nr:YdeI/OmpD-associated family protein [Candidatus Tenebribacter burtonii]
MENLLYFDNLTPSQQRNYISWIDSAKKQETKLRRLAQAIEMMRKS